MHAGPSQQQAEPGASAGPEDEQGKTAEGEPAGTGAEGEGSEGDEEGSSSEGEEEGGDEEEDEEPSDMALAWEMLEMARVIYDKVGAVKGAASSWAAQSMAGRSVSHAHTQHTKCAGSAPIL